MKYIKSIMLVLSIIICSCTNNNNEPPLETQLPVVQSYLPATVEFNINDSEWIEKIKPWADARLIVNDLSELPTDPVVYSNAFNGIDFSRYTLLIAFEIHDWTIDTYRTRFFRENIDGTYNWTYSVGTTTIPGNDSETRYFTRFAVLVNKLPADAEVKMWLSLGALNWGFE